MVVRMTIIFEVDMGVASIRDEGVVQGWVTSWEVLVLHSIFNYFLCLVTNISHVRDIY